MISSLRRITHAEGRLFLREPVGLVFVFAFPALTVLILGGVFDEHDPGFGGAAPSDYYVAASIAVVLAAIGFVMLPAHLAAYRERSVHRRFDASHFPPWALPSAWIAVSGALAAVSMAVLLATAKLSYGIPAIDHVAATLAAIGLGTVTYLSIGLLLGLLVPTARAAQGIGLTLFFPSFLLGGGGPPTNVMPPVMRSIANVLPMTHVVGAIQRPWLSIGGSSTIDLIVLAGFTVASTAGWIFLANRTRL